MLSPWLAPGAADQCHATSKREKFKIKAVAIATPLPDSTNQWSPWGCEMRQGKASVLHKECGTGSRAAHTRGNTPFCTHTTKAAASSKKKGQERVAQRKGREAGNNWEDMVRSCEQGIPAWVFVGTLLFHSVTVRGGKMTTTASLVLIVSFFFPFFLFIS